MQSNEHVPASTGTSHVQGVKASSGGLLAATLGAAIVAGAILTFIWLPAEHGVDPTGVGHVLGLTEMGHIKEQLHADADADAISALEPSDNQNATDTGARGSDTSSTLSAIQSQLSAIQVSVAANATAINKLGTTGEVVTIAPTKEMAPVEVSWRDEVSYTLIPGQGIEVKLVMEKGAVADYEWSANGGVIYHDTHGDGKDQTITYEKARAVPSKAGQLTAAFYGNHGWYWKNRTEEDILITLRTRGAYQGMLRP